MAKRYSAKQKSRYLYAVLITFLVVLGLYYAWLGYYQTYYGLGIFLVPMGLLGGLIVWSFLFLLYWKGLGEERRRSMDLAAQITLMLVNGYFVFLIAQHKIERYKPSFFVHVPDDYVGCVYLYPTVPTGRSTELDSLGVGYIPHSDKYKLVLLRNGVNVTKALETGNHQELNFYREDSTIMDVYSVGCAIITEDGHYPDFSVYSTILMPCMDEIEFQKMIQWGQVDRDLLVHRFWKRRPDPNDPNGRWEFMGTFMGDSLID